MNLLRTLALIEFRRLKIQQAIFGVLFVVFVLWLGIDINSFSELSFQMDSNDEKSSEAIAKLTEAAVEGMFAILLPLMTLTAAGALTAITLPFRSPREYQEGQFQMIKMSSWSLYRVQLMRYGLYSAGTFVFFGILGLAATLAVASKVDSQFIPLLRDLNLIYWASLLTTIPILLAAGMVVDACRTAYALRGIHFIISIIQFAGLIALLRLVQAITDAMNTSMLPPIPLDQMSKFFGPIFQGPKVLYWEPIIIGLLVAVAFVVLSGRILEEAEA